MKRNVILLVSLLASVGSAIAASPKVPNFFARRDYLGLNAYWVQVADTNGDGIPDLLANFNGYMQVLFGNGDGTFRSGPNTLLSGYIEFIAADLNGDGIMDVVLSNGGITVSLGNGDGTFQSSTAYQVPDSNIFGIAIGDFNSDSIPDVVVAGPAGVWLFTGKGGGTFNAGVLAVPLPFIGWNVAAADFNGDHKLDLVANCTCGQVAVAFGKGNGTFQSPVTLNQLSGENGMAVGPLRKGGPPGIIVSAVGPKGGGAYLYYNNGAGRFSVPLYVDLPGTCCLALGDVNGDGFPDLVSNAGYIAYGTASGVFKKVVSYPIQSGMGNANVVLADLRNKGLTDVVTDSPGGISVLLNQGKAGLADGLWTSVTDGAGCGVSADFNRDGKPDVAVNNVQGVSILLGTGKAAAPLTAGATIALPNAACLVTGDLNKDGIPDLLVPANGTVNAYLGNGDGTFALASTAATPSGGYLALGDFNHDGKPDFVTSGNLLALGKGDGTFQTPVPYIPNVPSGFSNLAVGDINNDGWSDVVLTNSNIGPVVNLTVLLNNRHGAFTQVPTNFGGETYQAILADVNKDGNLDVVISYLSGGGTSIYFGNGAGEFGQGMNLVDPMNLPGFSMVADLNGDGLPDIAIVEGDTAAIYLGTGHGAFAEPAFCIGTGPSPGDLLAVNLHGQSRMPDLVAPDNSGGVMVLINEGTQTSGTNTPYCYPQ